MVQQEQRLAGYNRISPLAPICLFLNVSSRIWHIWRKSNNFISYLGKVYDKCIFSFKHFSCLTQFLKPQRYVIHASVASPIHHFILFFPHGSNTYAVNMLFVSLLPTFLLPALLKPIIIMCYVNWKVSWSWQPVLFAQAEISHEPCCIKCVKASRVKTSSANISVTSIAR